MVLAANKDFGDLIKKAETSPKVGAASASCNLQSVKDSLSLSLHVSTDSAASDRTPNSSLTPIISGSSLKSTLSSTSPTNSAKGSVSTPTDQDSNQSGKEDPRKTEEMNGSEEIACALCAQLFHSEEQVRLHVELKHTSAAGGNECGSADDSRKRSPVSASSGSSTFAVDNLIQKGRKSY